MLLGLVHYNFPIYFKKKKKSIPVGRGLLVLKPMLPFFPAASSIYKGSGPKPQLSPAFLAALQELHVALHIALPEFCGSTHHYSRQLPALPLGLSALPVVACWITLGSPIVTDDRDRNATRTEIMQQQLNFVVGCPLL